MKISTNHTVLANARSARRDRALRHFTWVSGLVLLLCAGIVYVLRLPSLQLQQISVVGTVLVPQDAVLSTVESTVSGSYLGFIPRRNFLLYSREAIRASLQKNFLRIATVSFTEQSPRALLITITERQPVAVWCAGIFVVRGNRTCMYVDAAGVMYDSAPEFSGAIYFELYGPLGTTPSLGSHILTEEKMQHLQTLKELLVSMQIEPVALLIAADGTVELITSKGWHIVLGLEQDPRVAVAHLQAAFSAELFTKRLAERSNTLDYIDLRFGQKVFYKFATSSAAGAP